MHGSAPDAAGFPVIFPAAKISATRQSLKNFLSAVNAMKKKAEKAIKLEDEYTKLQIKYVYQSPHPQEWSTKKGMFSKSPYRQALAIFDEAQKLRPGLREDVMQCIRDIIDLSEDINMTTAYLVAPFAVDYTQVGRVDKEINGQMTEWTTYIDAEEARYKKAIRERGITDINAYRAEAKRKAEELKKRFDRWGESERKAA